MTNRLDSNDSGPDFVCIGMPRAGTGWLFDQLRNHPDFWLPPVKEVAYLYGGVPRMEACWRKLEKSQRKLQRAERQGETCEKELRDLSFLEAAVACSGKGRDMGLYASLFRFKGSLKSGDITPAYCRLDAETVSTLADSFPQVKIMLFVRDPVARIWSQFCLLLRRGKVDEGVLTDPSRFREYLRTWDRFLESSMATRIVSRWREKAPGLQFRHFFFDDLAHDPDSFLRDVLVYLGVDPNKGGQRRPPEHDKKADSKKVEMSSEVRNILLEQLADEVKACAMQLGGPALAWRDAYGL